jgi:hypothetical protein
MPRIRKRLLLVGGLATAGAVSALRRRRAARPSAPAPSAEAPATASASAVPEPVAATPPVEAPGPSVTPPGRRGRREQPPTAPVPESDALVEAETAAAAAEAGAIGGRARHDDPDLDPAMEPVSEAGGGESEGFELAEADLIDNASHGGGRGDPSRDAMRPEVEADEATGIAGEADEEQPADSAGASTSDGPRAR